MDGVEEDLNSQRRDEDALLGRFTRHGCETETPEPIGCTSTIRPSPTPFSYARYQCKLTCNIWHEMRTQPPFTIKGRAIIELYTGKFVSLSRCLDCCKLLRLADRSRHTRDPRTPRSMRQQFQQDLHSISDQLVFFGTGGGAGSIVVPSCQSSCTPET